MHGGTDPASYMKKLTAKIEREYAEAEKIKYNVCKCGLATEITSNHKSGGGGGLH